MLVTIADDDFVEPTGVELALTSNNGVFDSVAENSSQHNITVTASFSDIRWPTDAADAALRPADPRDVDTTVRVEFDSANSAAAQIDLERFQVMDSQGTFQGVESFDIVIPAGQTSGTTTLRFKPVNDDLDEEDETVILQGAEVVAADSDEFLPVSSASFTITDDDTRGITVSPASLATGSGIGMKEGGTSTYSLVLDTEPTDTVTVTVASEQDNPIRLTPETLTFTPSNWSTTQTISVESLDDGADTSFRDAFIAHQVSGGDYGSVSVGDIWVIIENTTQAYIYLDDAEASESDGHVEFTVSVRPILRTVPVVVRYTTVDGTAAAGTDYTRQVNTGQTYKIFSIPANGGAATIRIPITDNEVYGPAKKTFTLHLTNQNNKANLDGDATSLTATGSIIDDDPKPEVSVAGPAGDLSYVSEDKKGPVTFTLTLTGRSAADVTVDYATGQAQVLSGLAARQGITGATAGEDYTAAMGTVTFSPGDTTRHVTVQLTDDDVSEDTEFFGFKISNVHNAQLRNKATEGVVDMGLLDDDPRGVTISPTSISLDEQASGETAVASSYTVKLNSKPTDTVTVTVGGTNPAVSLSGTTLSNTNTLTFTASNWDTAQTVTVTPVKDANGTGETITLTHMQSGGDYNGIAADSVTINVTDSDTRNVVLSPTSLTLTEGDDTGVSYTVKLASQPTGAVTVTIGGHAGTGLSISGTTLSNTNTLTFTASNWNTAQTVTVKAGEDDNADDESETLTHTASGGDYANVTRDLPVTITDDDQADIVLSKTDLTVTEGDAAGVTYTVALATEPSDSVTVSITGHDGTDLSLSGTTLSSDTLTFTVDDWFTAQTVTVKAGEDANADDELETLSHTASGGDYANITKNLPVTVEDDAPDTVTVTFGAASYTVAEGSSRTITVSLDEDPERTVIIPIETDDQGGATDSDYTGVPDSVTFEAGDTSKTFDISATEDNLAEAGEKVKLSFGTLPADATAGTPGETAVSIHDRTQGQDLPTPPTVHFENAAYSVTEGASVAVKVKLSKAPGSEAVIPISRANRAGATNADYSGVPDTLTFGATDTEKTITFAATDDEVDDDGEKVELSFGSLPGGITATSGGAAEATVAITDNDDATAKAIVLSPASITVEEENATGTSYTVKLSEAPTADVTVIVSGLSGTDLIISGTTLNANDELTFSTSNWNTAQTITVKAAADADPFDNTASLLHRSSGGGYDSASRTLPVTVADDDTATVVLDPASLTVEEGSATGASYTVKLSHQPSGAVTVTITGHDGTDLTISGTTLNASNELTFTTANWDTAQTVTVKAGHDGNAASESLKLTHTPSGGGYSTAADLPVTVTDDDTAAIVLDPVSLSVEEGDTTGVSYTVELSTQPSETVTVTIGGHAGTDLSISGATLSSDTLTFTVDDWFTAQTVTVKAGEDANADDELETLSHTASGGDYANITKNLPVTVEDDAPDTVTVTFGAASYTVAEGSSRTITVSLDEDPERTVVIPIETDDQGGATDSDYTGVPDSVTFEAGDTSKTFDISATEDNLAEAGEKVKLSFGTLPADATAGTPGETAVSIHDRTQGQDLPTPPTVHFENAAYSVTEGASVAVKVKLSKAPGSEAVIPISRANRAGATNADYSGVPDTLTFGATDTEKTITFAATDDEVDDDGEKVELSFGSLPGGITATSGGAAEATVAITDNDDATAKAIVLSPASITVEEENATGTSYTVKLSEAPTADVTVIVSGLSGTDLIISGTTLNANDELTFSTSNWNTAQTITVKAAADADPFDNTASLLHRSSGGGYDSASRTLPVTVADDDTATVVLDPASLTVEEGSATGASYTVKLSHQPSGAVTVTITGHDGTDLTISGTTLNASNELTFTTANWDTAQTVTVKAGHDGNAASESLKLTHTPSGGGYSTAADLPVTVTDDDTAAIVLDPVSLSVEEGDTTGVSYTVELSTQPSETVTVTIGGHAGTDLSISGATLSSDTLTFTVDDWFTAQTVTVKAGEDANADDELETLSHTASGGDYANITKNLPVTVEDDAPDTVTVTFGAASYTVAEGSSRTITVSLDEDPERTVVIPIETDDQGGATDSDYTGVPDSVTFEAGDTSKTFDISATEDNLAEAGEKVKLSFGTLPADATAGTPGETAVSIHDRTQGQDLPTPPTVHFENAAYSVTEGASVAVKVKLSKAPGSEAVIPISRANRAGATNADYSGVPDTLTFGVADTEKTITFAATDDSVDDDGEKVELSFGSLPGGITATAGEAAEAVVTIVDDDKPTALTVEFGQAAYTAAEGSTVTVKVTLSDDPEMDLTIPISKTNEGGASDSDYSGVPESVTFDSGDTEKTFVFTAETDAVDDDGESVKLSFGTLPTTPVTVTAGTTDEATVTITDDDVPSVTVSFGSAAYTVAESDDSDTTGVTENTVEVTVTLSADPERTVVIPIETANQGGATSADYSGVPESVTFDSGDTSKSFTFTAAHDTVDDDSESVKLSFGATLPDGVSAGTPATSTVSITDDDDPQVTVAFGQSAYSAAEGSIVTVEVTLSADPERNVSIPIEKTNQGGATAADYSGVPESVTFDSGETQKSFVFTAETDTDDDHGESVRLSFNTMPDARVSEGSPSEAMVSIRQGSTPSTADCNSAIWCADLEFRSESPPGEMWFLGSTFLDSQFHYGGVTYRFGHSSVAPYGHNIPISGQPNPPWAISERTKFYFSLHNMNASGYDLDRFRVPNDDWMDWTLHISTTKNGETLTAVLPFSEARFGGGQSEWRWYGSDLEALRAAWTDGQVYKLKIVEDPRSQRTLKVLGPPLYLKVTPYTNHTLGAWWKMPENRVDRAPPNTTYKVQWKEASDSWDNPADVSEETDSPSPATNETLSHSIRGLTGGVEYHVRVIATNTVGDSEPSEVVNGTPTPLPAAGQNIAANSPAKGAPSIEGTPEVGQTLSAVTTDIADDDGLQDVVFSYQWLADDVEISGADGATYILTSDDLGKAINVRVDFTDNAGNEESLTSAPTAAVTAAEDLEIQSATVDGTTLTLTYNETLDTGVTLPASAFVVNVNEASRSIMGAGVGGSSVLLLLSSAVETGDTVTVDYTAPDGQDFIGDTQGRKAESFSGQEVTNNTAPAETERSDPAQTPGSPNSLKVVRHESGKLMATWAAPDSGSDPTGYTLQWKEAGDGWETQDSVSEADVKGTSHLITGLTDGVEYAVRVIASRDDSESAPSGEVTATPRETTPPSPSSVSVNGATLTVTFDEALAEVQALASTAFAVTVAGNSRGVSAVAVSGSAVTLTLVTAVSEGDAVTVDYTAPMGESAARLQDLAGNVAASFSGLDAGNDTQAADQLTASAHDVPGSHDGSTVFTFELRFSENFHLSYKTLRDHAFTVTGGAVTGARRLAPPSNIGWEIQVEPDGDEAATIVLPVTTDCTAEGAICTEDGRMLSGGLLLVVPGPNTPATGLPTITGTAQVGDTLTAVTTGIEDADGLDSAAFSYQWLADDAEINGATASTYTLVAADAGKAIKVQVSFTDDAGNDEELNSAATAAVAAAPPPPNTPATGLPTITGTAEVGDTLTAVTTGIEDADGLDSAAFSYQWLADNADIAGATGSSYTLIAADAGKAIKVQVSFTDDAGNDEELNSAATAAVAAAPPPPNTPATGLPTITGTAEVGDTLTAVTTAIEDADGLDSAAFSYQWIRNDGGTDTDISEATGSSYTLGDSDVDKTVKVRVSFTDDANNRETMTSAATAAVAARPNSLATGAPTISGTAQVGETLTADTSGIADEDGLTNASFAYQWQADGADISGATDSSYTLAVDDESKVVSVKVSFSDDAGNEEESTSAATAAVEADSLPPLTASLENIATSHDGENAFTFELRFSEEFNLSYKIMRGHAFTVIGGQVTKARRLVPRSNVGWEIHVQPDGDGTVTIVLPATTDCTAEGAICTQDGRKLSNRLEITVQGPAG